MTSKASSIQPRAAAIRVRRWSRVEVAKVAGSGAVDIARIISDELRRASRREQAEVSPRALHVAPDLVPQRVYRRELDLVTQPAQEADLDARVGEHVDGMEVQQVRLDGE